MQLLVNNNHVIFRTLASLTGITAAEISRRLVPPVTRTHVCRVARGFDKSPRVRAEIIRSLGLPDDFFEGDYELVITLRKKKSEAA